MSFYDDASWLLIPSGIKEDVVYAQKPTSGLGDLTFTRASDATYTDSTGVVRRSPYNLLQQSEMFSNAIWVKTGSTIGIDATLAPNGTLTADNLIEDTSSGLHFLTQTITVVANTTYTGSIYIKANTRTKGIFRLRDTSGQPATDGNFDLTTGTISFGTITNVGGGWYRLSLSRLMASTSASLVLFLADNSGNISYTGNGTSGIFAWGAQLVEGTEALDYFPTTNRQDVPRIDFRNADGTLSSCGRLLLEPQRTNSIRNSSMVGAVAGTPGTLPTNYIEVLGGLTRSVVAVGTENGLPYVDLRFNGTASTSVEIRFEGTTSIAATTGQAWTLSTYAKIISGTFNSASLYMIERTSGGSIVTSGFQSVTPTSTLQRLNYTRTLSGGATVAAVQPAIVFFLTIGQSYDFTIRIAAPQMELGGYATTWVPTTTAAVTRLADTASKTGVSSLIGQTEGTLFAEVNWGIKPETGSPIVSILTLNNNVTNIQNAIILGIERNSVGQNRIYCLVQVSNVTQAALFGSTITSGNYKIALAYKQNDFVLYVNGVQIATDSSGNVPTTSQILLGQRINGDTFVTADGIAQAALFPTRLSNAELAQLTTL